MFKKFLSTIFGFVFFFTLTSVCFASGRMEVIVGQKVSLDIEREAGLQSFTWTVKDEEDNSPRESYV